MTTKYAAGGVKVSIGRSQDVQLPPRVLHGRATCMHFDTDKAFLLPPSVPGVRNIVAFFREHPASTMLVNGHTDLVGDAAYNVQLSNERAAAVTAYLLERVDDWLAWYSSSIPSKRWSYTEDQHMLATVLDGNGLPYYAAEVTGSNDSTTQDAARRFQTDRSLPVDGQLGPETRRALIAQYMQLQGTSLPSGTPIVQHGCGKYHPVDATTAADQGNRRVEIFLFDGGVDPAPQHPCPSPGCSQYARWVELASDTRDLCDCPPETTGVIRICLIDGDHKPRGGVEYTLVVGGQTYTGTTGDDGMIAHPVPAGVTDGQLTYDDYTRQVAIQPIDEPHRSTGAQPRLENLGFVGAAADMLRLAIERFQQRNELPVTGELDDTTAQTLRDRHGS